MTSLSDIAPGLISAGVNASTTMVDTTALDARQKFDAIVAALNTRIADRYLLSGAATDKKPVAGSQEILAALAPAIAGQVTAQGVADAVTAFFDAPAGGGGYLDTVYGGSAAGLADFRIGPQDQVGFDLTAADPAIRNMLSALTLGALVADGALPGDSSGRALLLRRSGEGLIAAGGGLTALQRPCRRHRGADRGRRHPKCRRRLGTRHCAQRHRRGRPVRDRNRPGSGAVPDRDALHPHRAAFAPVPGGFSSMKTKLTLVAIILSACVLSTIAGATPIRIKDLVEFDGVRGNDLVGYGLVVGLNGTGDGMRNAPFTEEIMSNILERLGVNVTGEQFRPEERRGGPRHRHPAALCPCRQPDRRHRLGDRRREKPARRHPGDDAAQRRRRRDLCRGAGHDHRRRCLGGGRGARASPRACRPPALIPSGARVEREIVFDFARIARYAAGPAQPRLHHRRPDRGGDQRGIRPCRRA